jgi:hypothetical protein
MRCCIHSLSSHSSYTPSLSRCPWYYDFRKQYVLNSIKWIFCYYDWCPILNFISAVFIFLKEVSYFHHHTCNCLEPSDAYVPGTVVFWDVTPCGLVEKYQSFGLPRLNHQNVTVISSVIKMEEADSSETLITIHQTARRHIPETSIHITVEISNLIFFGQVCFCNSRFPVQFFYLPTLKEYIFCPEESIEDIFFFCLLKNQERIKRKLLPCAQP